MLSKTSSFNWEPKKTIVTTFNKHPEESGQVEVAKEDKADTGGNLKVQTELIGYVNMRGKILLFGMLTLMPLLEEWRDWMTSVRIQKVESRTKVRKRLAWILFLRQRISLWIEQ